MGTKKGGLKGAGGAGLFFLLPSSLWGGSCRGSVAPISRKLGSPGGTLQNKGAECLGGAGNGLGGSCHIPKLGLGASWSCDGGSGLPKKALFD